MPHFVYLTPHGGKNRILVNLDQVRIMRRDQSGGTFLRFGPTQRNCMIVREDVGAILAMVEHRDTKVVSFASPEPPKGGSGAAKMSPGHKRKTG